MEMIPKVDRLEAEIKDLREAFLLYIAISNGKSSDATVDEKAAAQLRLGVLCTKMSKHLL